MNRKSQIHPSMQIYPRWKWVICATCLTSQMHRTRN